MGALPKRKYAKARQGKRRSHLHLTPLALVTCERCRSLILPHHACPTCGTYLGREVLEVKGPKKREQ